jgi:predicted RNA-binding protein with PUA domain
LIEMAFACALDKKIYLLNPIPEMNYSDEIFAMKPIVLSGDLSKI